MEMEGRDHRLLADIDRVLVTEDAIRERVRSLGAEIERSTDTHELTLVLLLHGSIFFAADLMRALTLPLYVESIRVASYHGGTTSSGTLAMEATRFDHLRDRDVLLVDDILDTGRTLHAVRESLASEVGVRSLRSCVLLDKAVSRAVSFRADYVGFTIGNEFVVGYGLDYQGRYRNLPFIGTLKPEIVAGEQVPSG